MPDITTTARTLDGFDIWTGMVAFDNNLALVVVTGPADAYGWFPTLRIGGYGTGRDVGSSDAGRLSTSYRNGDGRLVRASEVTQEISPELALRHGKVLWTLVSIAPRARFARPVAGAVVTASWIEASRQSSTVERPEGTEVWYVPAQGSKQHPEDEDNLLLDSGRRVPIKWDAKPLVTV